MMLLDRRIRRSGLARPLANARSVVVLALLLLAAAIRPPGRAEDAGERFPDSAPLKTDPELERLLTRAEQFANQGRYDLASILWQKALEESADTLVTRDGRMYVPLAEQVERTIAKLPPAALRLYRITADGEAKALLAGGLGERREAALAAVVRRYFLSSYGDDAAYTLGCLALDRYDFVGASRLFAKILHQHPDPSMPRADLWLRLAVAAAHVGDTASAAEALDQLQQASGPAPAESVLAAVRADVKRAGAALAQSSRSPGDWPMALGDPSRRGRMRRLPAAVTAATLTKMWGCHFPVLFTPNSSGLGHAIYFHQKPGAAQPVQVAQSDRGLIQRWRAAHWMPAGQLLLADGRVYFKTNSDLVCWDARAESDQPIWRTAWLNLFQRDAMSEMLLQIYRNLGGWIRRRDDPISSAEVMLFGDRIHHSMSISRGVLYSVEGPRLSRYEPQTRRPPRRRFQWQWGMAPRRSRANWLAAYDARTGKAKWYRSPRGNEKAEENDLGFMAAPVPFGNFLLVPVTDAGTIWLYALSCRDGSTVWRTYLCDEPPGGCDPWSPVGVSVDGRDAYVVCGAGVVFALDALSGDVRFAVRYERHGTLSPLLGNVRYSGSQVLDLKGWDDDIAIPYGRQLVVMASDHDALFAIDRRTGRLLWSTPRTPNNHPGSYCLGVAGTGYFVGGSSCVRRYDLDKDGKLMWETEIDDSFGRGVLTGDAIYVPVNDSIVRIDLQSGRVTSQVGVHVSVQNDPVGNLYSDGQKLWVISGNNLFALTNRDQRLEVLAHRIQAGDVAACLERMQLYAKEGQLDEAIADLAAAYRLTAEARGRSEALRALAGGLTTISLPALRPGATLDLLGRLCRDDADAHLSLRAPDELRRPLESIIFTSLGTIRDKRQKGRARSIVAIAPLLERPPQQRLAEDALLATMTEDDAALLQSAAASRHAAVRIVVAEPMAVLLREAAKEPLKRMLAAPEDRVRYAAARALARLGDRSSLAALVALLDSGDPRIRLQSVNVLRSLTGQQFEFEPNGDAQRRAGAVQSWQRWLQSEGATVELRLPLPTAQPMLGRTLIASYGENKLVELDAHRQVRWEKSLHGVWAVQGLPNGHRLAALYAHKAVVEFDEQGREVWRKDKLPGNPFSVRRLPNGNTLVACSSSQQVVEIRPDGSVAWQITVTSSPMDARRLANGNTLVALVGGHRVVEVGNDGTVVWEVGNLSGPISAQRLANGHTLVAQSSGGRVVEIDRQGRVVWQKTGLSQPFDAQRLPNGDTLIAQRTGVLQVDSRGRVIWRWRGQGVSGVSRF